jgi:predicted branched-subunit amino acid permease
MKPNQTKGRHNVRLSFLHLPLNLAAVFRKKKLFYPKSWSPERRSAAQQGIIDIAPQLIATVPFGLVTGVACVAAGMTTLQAIALSFAAFSGIAQLVLAQSIASNAHWLISLAAVTIVSARLAMYSAALSPTLSHFSRGKRMFMAYVLTDQAFAIGVTRYRDQTNDSSIVISRAERDAHYFAAAVLAFVVWQSSIVVGALVGALIPTTWALDFAVTLSFLTLLPKSLGRRSDLAAALVSATLVVIAAGLPYRTSLLVATLTGIIVGMVVERLPQKHGATS